MIRSRLSHILPSTVIALFALTILILLAGMAYPVPAAAQVPTQTPIPLLQTLNARMTNSIVATPTPPASDELDDLIAELPKSRTENGGYVLGDPDAPVTLIIFEDFGCPHCQNYHEIVVEFIETYVASGEASLESRIFPTAGGQLTVQVGQYLECAEEQREGIYWELYGKLYQLSISGNYNANALTQLFSDIDIDPRVALSCVETASQVATDVAYAQTLKVTGTPAVRIRYGDSEPVIITMNGTLHTGGGVPFSVIAELVEAANT